MEKISIEEYKKRLGHGQDLGGTKIGHLQILYPLSQRASNGTIIWHCLCDCGNECDIEKSNLMSRKNRPPQQTCGCELSKTYKLDITGERFGKLVALYPLPSEGRNKHTKWMCQCDCGNQVAVDLGNLRQGFTKSCGCTLSTQEENIIKLLTQNNIPFNYQYKFKDFPTKKFDFYINNQYIIEYDGSQHFTYTGSGWDTQKHYERTHKSDLEKNHYCFNNNIPLIRIPYNQEYNIDDLKLETTHFLLTPNNEKAYYQII